VNGRLNEKNGLFYVFADHSLMAKPPPQPEGFSDQHLVVLPHSVILQMQRHPLLCGLFPTATGYFPQAPGHLVKRHQGVPEMILIACLSGRGWVEIEDRGRITVQANEAVVIPPATAHGYGADENEPWSIMWVHCRGGEVANYLKQLAVTKASPLLRTPAGAFDRMGFPAIYGQLEHGYTIANLLVSAARLRLVLAEIHRLRVPAYPGTRSSGEGLEQSIQWMRQHIDHRARLPELARLAGLSVPHYSTLFRGKTGFSPIDYFLRLKIQRACQLLDTTAMRIEEIAICIGCDDPYYFSRLFKKIMGKPPRAYRKIQKG
jgi:AraC family transcriptional regulator of arabinose operon